MAAAAGRRGRAKPQGPGPARPQRAQLRRCRARWVSVAATGTRGADAWMRGEPEGQASEAAAALDA